MPWGRCEAAARILRREWGMVSDFARVVAHDSSTATLPEHQGLPALDLLTSGSWPARPARKAVFVSDVVLAQVLDWSVVPGVRSQWSVRSGTVRLPRALGSAYAA